MGYTLVIRLYNLNTMSIYKSSGELKKKLNEPLLMLSYSHLFVFAMDNNLLYLSNELG